GVYKVIVDNQFNADATGAYSFRLWNVPPPVVVPIAINQQVSGSLDIPGEEDHYTFTATAGQRLFFDGQLNSGHGIHVKGFTILKPDGTVLLANSEADRDTFVLPTSGLYKVVVGDKFRIDATGAYQFQIFAVPDTVAVPITLNQVVSSSIVIPGEEDLYTFN